MLRNRITIISKIPITTTLLGLVLLVGLYIVSLNSYLLFHSLAEVFSIIIAGGIFMFAWNSRRIINNNYLLFIGIAYAFIAGIDLIHTLAYTGMGVFQGYDSNLPTQLWIAARYLQSISLLVAPLFLHRDLKIKTVIFGYAIILSLLLASIFYWDIFPTCYVEGVGLTAFKKTSEYIISLILLTSFGLLLINRQEFSKDVLRWLFWSIVATIGSEIAFTFYVSVFGLSNLLGHFFKIIAFYLVYKAIIETGFVKPYNLLFRNLKQSEKTLQKSNDELKRRALQLESTNKELEAFSYSVSHDLRAPLRALDGLSHILVEDYAAVLPEEANHFLRRVRLSAQKMDQLISDLLLFSQMGRHPLKKVRTSIDEIISQALEEFQGDLAGRNVEIIHSELIDCWADPALLKQVYINLLANAIKFTRNREHTKIELGCLKPNGAKNETVYFIKDNGVGFDMQETEKLFGVFQRLHRDEDFEGTGVGLATVQRIIHRHGGRTWAEAEVDKGATFYFSLPNDEFEFDLEKGVGDLKKKDEEQSFEKRNRN